jgi:type I restriction enzyme R subunit
MNLPKGKGEPVDVDDKVLLEYYRLEKEFEGEITLTPTEEGFRPITGEAGRGDKKKDPLTLIIDKINEKFGTNFTEMDKVLLQIQNDYAADDRWLGYAKNNDLKTFMLLFEKDFINMAAQRYEQNEAFFVKLFTDPDMLMQVMAPLGGLLYDRLRRGKAAGAV